MAYKFQRGEAILSGSLLQEGNVEIESGFQLIIGNAKLTEAELEQIDGVSAGTVAASKAVVVDSNKDASGFRNIGAAQLTTSGRVIVDDATEATSTTDGSLQTDGGLSVAKSAVIGDDLDMLSDAAILNFGADKDVNLTHVADTGLLLNSSMQMQFGDSGTYIHQSADGVLDLVSDTEIEINATTVDINGAIDASSTIVAASSITAGTSFIIGSADLNETDLEKLDGITNGTAAASKAVVLDANKDVSGLRDISGRKATLSSLTQGRLVTAGSSGLLEDQGELVYDDARSHGYLEMRVSSSASGSSVIGDGYVNVSDKDENPMFQVSKYQASDAEEGLFFSDVAAPGATAVATDVILFQDGDDDSRYKKEALGDIRDLFFGVVSGDATVAAGGALTIAADAVESGMLNDNVISGQTELAADGLAAADELLISDGGTLKKIGVDNLFLDGPGLLAEAALTVADDYIMFLDGGATGDAKKESVSDLMASVAGTGLKAASGVLALDANELSEAAVASGDFIVIEDATDNSTKKESVDDLATLFAGTGLAAASAVLSLDLNELSAAAVDVSADSIAIIDANDSNGTRKESIADLVSAMAGAGLTATSGQLKVSGNDVHLKANGDTLQEGYNYFADIGDSDAVAAVSLPAAPSVGDVVNVKAGDLADDKYVRISRQGSHTIDGQTSIDLESPFAAVSLVYVVADNWRIV